MGTFLFVKRWPNGYYEVYVYIYFFIIRVSGLTIATDLICGFPTETEEVDHLFIFSIIDFNNSQLSRNLQKKKKKKKKI